MDLLDLSGLVKDLQDLTKSPAGFMANQTRRREWSDARRGVDLWVDPHPAPRARDEINPSQFQHGLSLVQCLDRSALSAAATIFEGTHLPMRKRFLVMYLLTQGKHVIFALDLKRQIGVSFWTVLDRQEREPEPFPKPNRPGLGEAQPGRPCSSYSNWLSARPIRRKSAGQNPRYSLVPGAGIEPATHGFSENIHHVSESFV